MTTSDVLTLRHSEQQTAVFTETCCIDQARHRQVSARSPLSNRDQHRQDQGIQVEPHRGGRAAERWLLLCELPAQFEAECHDMSHQG